MVFKLNATGKEKPIKAFDPKCGNNKSNIESLHSVKQDRMRAGEKMKQVHQQTIDTETQALSRKNAHKDGRCRNADSTLGMSSVSGISLR